MQRHENDNSTPMALSLSASDHSLNQQIISYFSLKILRGQIILVEILGEKFFIVLPNNMPWGKNLSSPIKVFCPTVINAEIEI